VCYEELERKKQPRKQAFQSVGKQVTNRRFQKKEIVQDNGTFPAANGREMKQGERQESGTNRGRRLRCRRITEEIKTKGNGNQLGRRKGETGGTHSPNGSFWDDNWKTSIWLKKKKKTPDKSIKKSAGQKGRLGAGAKKNAARSSW